MHQTVQMPLPGSFVAGIEVVDNAGSCCGSCGWLSLALLGPLHCLPRVRASEVCPHFPSKAIQVSQLFSVSFSQSSLWGRGIPSSQLLPGTPHVHSRSYWTKTTANGLLVTGVVSQSHALCVLVLRMQFAVSYFVKQHFLLSFCTLHSNNYEYDLHGQKGLSCSL